MGDIKQISDIPQRIIVISGITISILLSLFVQLSFIDKLSLYSSVTFVIYIY